MKKVQVKAEVFGYYLAEYGLSVEKLAEKSGINADLIKNWADSDSDVPISSLRKLANIYKKHWGIFLINHKTTSFKRPKDFRKRGSQPLGLQASLSFEEASRLIGISSSLSLKKIDANLHKYQGVSVDAVTQAENIRKLLGLTKDKYSQWKKPEDSYKYLKSKIEELGIIISIVKIDDENLDGFIMQNDEGAVIVLNKNSENLYRRSFTLLHELGHYLQNVSASCLTYYGKGSTSNEKFADDFASEVLLPTKILTRDEIIRSISGGSPVIDEQYSILSKRYSISMSAVAVRLAKLNLITSLECDTKISQFNNLYRENLAKKKQLQKEKGGFDPKGHERSALNRVGKNIADNVINDYYQGKVSLREAAGLLNVKVNMVGKIEALVRNE